MNLAEVFDTALIRFAVSGTLILFYGMADGYARRRAQAPAAKVPGTVWMKVTIVVSITAYYALIAPFGGAIWGGLGNLLGVALVGVAMALRIVTARGTRRLRQPETAARLLFYVALPLAVGVPLGWLALTLPAFVASAINAVREDRLLVEQMGDAWVARMATTHRWIPGIW